MVAFAAQMHKSEPIFNDIFQSQKYTNEFSDINEPYSNTTIEDYMYEKKDKPSIITMKKKNIDWMPDIKNLPRGFPKYDVIIVFTNSTGHAQYAKLAPRNS